MANFKTKAYGKSDLAMQYFPQANSLHSAVNHLMTWVHQSPKLMAELEKLGYRKTSKYFTPKQVALIVEYLGEP